MVPVVVPVGELRLFGSDRDRNRVNAIASTAMEDHEADDVEPVKGALAAMLVAKLAPWLIRIGSYLTLAGVAGGYSWWVWRRAKKLEAAGVEPPPAPLPPLPGPLPPASPPRW